MLHKWEVWSKSSASSDNFLRQLLYDSWFKDSRHPASLHRDVLTHSTSNGPSTSPLAYPSQDRHWSNSQVMAQRAPNSSRISVSKTSQNYDTERLLLCLHWGRQISTYLSDSIHKMNWKLFRKCEKPWLCNRLETVRIHAPGMGLSCDTLPTLQWRWRHLSSAPHRTSEILYIATD